LDEVHYIRKLNRMGISVLDAFIFEIDRSATCAKCNKKFDKSDKFAKYQHYIDKHL